MALNLKNWFNIKERLQHFLEVEYTEGRYHNLRRNIRILMIALTIIPLVLMALINYHQYQSSLISQWAPSGQDR